MLANKQIQDLKLYCDNHGCVWTGTVGNFEKHKAQCGYAKVPCPNNCSKQLLRKYLDKHLHCECVKRKCSCGWIIVAWKVLILLCMITIVNLTKRLYLVQMKSAVC